MKITELIKNIFEAVVICLPQVLTAMAIAAINGGTTEDLIVGLIIMVMVSNALDKATGGKI